MMLANPILKAVPGIIGIYISRILTTTAIAVNIASKTNFFNAHPIITSVSFVNSIVTKLGKQTIGAMSEKPCLLHIL